MQRHPECVMLLEGRPVRTRSECITTNGIAIYSLDAKLAQQYPPSFLHFSSSFFRSDIQLVVALFESKSSFVMQLRNYERNLRLIIFDNFDIGY